MKKKQFTEFAIMIDQTSLGEALLILVNERNEAYIDDDEIEPLIHFLRDFLERKAKATGGEEA